MMGCDRVDLPHVRIVLYLSPSSLLGSPDTFINMPFRSSQPYYWPFGWRLYIFSAGILQCCWYFVAWPNSAIRKFLVRLDITHNPDNPLKEVFPSCYFYSQTSLCWVQGTDSWPHMRVSLFVSMGAHLLGCARNSPRGEWREPRKGGQLFVPYGQHWQGRERK